MKIKLFFADCKTRYLALLTVLTLFFTLGIGNAWGADMELTFSLTSNPGGWPTTNSTTLTNYTYTLSGTNYTFALKNVKCNSGYLMLTSTAVLGLPKISDKKLTKVVVSNSSGCSTSTRVGISSSSSSASYITGGAYQTYSSTSSNYTYNLSGTSNNTMYYLYITNKNCQITQIKLTYSGDAPATTVTADPTSITFANNTLSNDEASGSSTVDLSVTNGNKSSGNYLWVWVESDHEDDCDFTINSSNYSYGSGNNTSINDLSVEYYAVSAGTWTGRVVAQGYNSSYEAVNCTIPLSVTITGPTCSANPTVGNAANNGALVYSTTPMTVSVTCPSIGAGSSCSIKDYGFVWNSGSNPTISTNKTQIGTDNHSTAFSGNISGTFAAGTTYYVKAYAINNGDNTTLSSGTYSFTPRSITMNSNGGSPVATILVISGTAATQPANPTKTGYTFAGWYSNEGLTTAVNWSNTIGSNKTYYAKWTAKTTTISFNQTSGTGGQTGTLTATYGSAMPSAPVTCPTRDGYDFGGYYDGSGGTGTQYYTNTGASAKNWDKENATYTLHAKWTLKSYTVTWKVNNVSYSAGGSTSVNHGSHISTLPTAPDPDDYCGDRFVGWTDAEDGAYVHGTSNLYKTASEFPNATEDQVFYAVFADYVTP